MAKSVITINQRQNEIKIKINEEAEHEQIVKELKKKIKDLSKMYKDEKTPINVTGKVLKTKELNEINEIIKKEINVYVNFDTPRDLGLHGIKKTFEKPIENSDTLFYKGSLRSRTKN